MSIILNIVGIPIFLVITLGALVGVRDAGTGFAVIAGAFGSLMLFLWMSRLLSSVERSAAILAAIAQKLDRPAAHPAPPPTLQGPSVNDTSGAAAAAYQKTTGDIGTSQLSISKMITCPKCMLLLDSETAHCKRCGFEFQSRGSDAPAVASEKIPTADELVREALERRRTK